MTAQVVAHPRRPKAPAKLGARGRRLWDEVLASYRLRPDELVLLVDACREVDLIDRMERELDRDGELLVRGSMGQQVAHPLLAELRQHRAALKQLLAALHLPDESGREAASRSEAARAAAVARWRRSG